MDSNKHISKYNTYIGIMIFAFLWVIIGDLVAMHIRVISDNNLNNSHIPYAKVQKVDKKCFKFNKKQKDTLSDDDSNSFILVDNYKKTLKNNNISNFRVAENDINNFILSNNLLRGPPLV